MQDLQEQVIKQQQCLENIDRKARECYIVLLGIPEGQEELEGAFTEDAMIQKIWTTIRSSAGVRSSWHLGKPGGRRRPVLVKVESREVRDAELERAK